MAKVLLICIDGLSWNLLHRFCEEGVLPNFDKIIKNGVSAELKSIYPLISPRIWATIFTGKGPAKHGVEDFYINAETIRSTQIWEILQENGHRVGVFKPLTAFRPNQPYSFFVPGLLSTENDAFPADLEFLNEFYQKLRAQADVRISPLDLVRYAYKFLRHGCRIRTLWKAFWVYLRLLTDNPSRLDKAHKLKRVETVLNCEVFIYCLKKYAPTFAIFYDNGTDSVSHFYWKYMEPEFFSHVDKKAIEEYGEVIRKHYVLIDKIIGKMISSFGDEAYLMVVSDHGFRACPNYEEIYPGREFAINVSSLLRLLNLEDKVYGIKGGSMGGIFRSKNEEMSPEEIERNFRNIRYKETGKQVFLVERVASYVNARVDVKVLDRTQNVILTDSSQCPLKDFLDFNSAHSADHWHEGVLIVKGPNIHTNEIIRNSSVYDIFPTILAINGIPISKDVDGKVLADIFREEIDVEYTDELTPIERGSIAPKELSKEEEIHITQRLKELGYI